MEQERHVECFDCKYKVGIGLALRIYYLKGIKIIDYEGLKEDYASKRKTEQEIMDILEGSVKEGTQEKIDIKELKGLMEIEIEKDQAVIIYILNSKIK